MDPIALENLQQLADTTDAANGAPLVDQATGDVLPPPPPPRDYIKEASGAIDTFGALVVGYAPKSADLWSTERKTGMAQALAPVIEKYGWSMAALPPEVTLVLVCGPVLYQSAKIVGQQMQDDRAKAKPQAITKPDDPPRPIDTPAPVQTVFHVG